MLIKVEGDTTTAPCEHCQKMVGATWRYGPFQLDSGVQARDVMQAYCDICGSSLLLAQQSVYRVREARERAQKRTSVNLTRPLKDLISSCALELGAEPERGPELILKAFLVSLSDEPNTIKKVVAKLGSLDQRLLKGLKNQKVDVSFSGEMFETLDHLARLSKTNRSEVMRRALLYSQETPEITNDVRKLAWTRGLKN